MENNVYQTPNADLEIKTKYSDVQLWNPDAAGAWSLLFTPVFGTILVRKNWIALGETDKAKTASNWLFVSILFAILSMLVGLLGFIYIIVWYFAFQKRQTQFIKTNFISYKKKPWLVPIGIAFGVYFGIFTLIALIITIASA